MDRLATGQHPPYTELQRTFMAAPEEYGPVPIWWWSGAKLDKKEMTRQLEMLAKGGVRHLMTVNLAPAGTIYGCLPDDPMLITEKWWDFFNHAVQECKRLGIHWWFYDQLGFSGASLQARVVLKNREYMGRKLKRQFRDVQGPADVSLEVPAFGEPIGAFMAQIIDQAPAPNPWSGAVEPGKPSRTVLEKVLNIKDRLSGKQLKVQVPVGLHRVELYYIVATGFDYHNPDAGSELLSILHGEVEKRFPEEMGKTIAGSFQDEMPSMPRFSASLPEQFNKRVGYDLLDYLPALFNDVSDHFGNPNNPSSAQVRCDASRVAAQLCEEAFFIPLADYHRRNNMWCGFDQTIRNGDPVNADRYYVDYFRTHRHFNTPGNEQSGDAKPHQSMADLYCHPRVWMEGFHSSGWGQTMEDIVNLLHPWVAEGSTLYNPHAIYFGTQGSYWEWAPPDTGWRQPYFAHYPYLVHYVERLCYLMTRGKHEVTDAIVYPASTVHAGSGWGVTGEEARKSNTAYWDAQKAFRAKHQYYIIIDESSIQSGRIENGKLCAGHVQLQTIYLPECQYLEGATLAKLTDFAKAGGRVVIMGEAPGKRADGFMSNADFAHCAEMLIDKSILIANAAEAPMHSAAPMLIDSANGPLAGLQRQVGDRRFWFFLAEEGLPTTHAALRQVNQCAHWDSLAARGGRLSVKVPGDGVPECWDAAGGRIVPILNYRRSGETTQAEVELKETPAPIVALRAPIETDPLSIESDLEITECECAGDRVRVIGLQRIDRMQPEPKEHQVRVEFADAVFEGSMPANPMKRMQLQEPFDFELAPTCDNTDASFDYPAYPGPIPVETRGFQYAEETDAKLAADFRKADFDDSKWSRALASFGPRAEWAGPLQMKDGESLESINQAAANGAAFTPAVYSPKLGIYQDDVFTHSHGSRGRISDEFVDVGPVKPGEVYLIRGIVIMPEDTGQMDALLRVGSRAFKRVFLNGQEVQFDSPKTTQKVQALVKLQPGANKVEILAARQKAGRLRLFYQFLDPSEAPKDPEWIWFEKSRRVGITRFTKIINLKDEIESATVAVALADLKHEVKVNSQVVAEKGGFDPYFTSRADRYDLKPYLKRGENRFDIDVIYTGEAMGAGEFTDVFNEGVEDRDEPVGLLVDGMVTLKSGRKVDFVSDMSFTTVAVDETGAPQGDPQAVRVLLEPLHNYFSTQENLLLYSRPHGLPEAGWLQDLPKAKAPFDRLVYAVSNSKQKAAWFRFLLPPGAIAIKLRTAGAASLYVNGQDVALKEESKKSGEAKGISYTAQLPDSKSPRRVAALRVEQAAGYLEGGAILEPVRYEMGAGKITLGSWDELGLPNYSGGIVYSTSFDWNETASGEAVLDLGRVRGSADVTVNGTSCGTRIWHPFRFDIAPALKKGGNRIEIRVFNTLGPHFGEGHPSGYVFDNQTQSGIFGPISVTMRERVTLDLERIDDSNQPK